ncbi:MAG: polysaccharide deacetylase family protein [Burkholderiales bacterium]
MREWSEPAVVISLDFELRWGVHDCYGLDFDAYRENLENVPFVIPELLKLFTARGIRATWAAVGALACKNWDEYFRRAPAPPRYLNPALAVKRAYADLDPDGILHFAPELVERILRTPGQDLGTHTFSHLYLREAGITGADVAADLAAVRQLYQDRFGFTPSTLVFPRNEYAFLDVVRASAIRMWRGNEAAWYYECQGDRSNWALPKALRMVDSLTPYRTRAACTEPHMTRASLFLRLNLPRFLWAVHVKRIQRELESAKPDHVLHLWFHPHNVGAEVFQRLARVEQVLDLIAEAQLRGLARSCSMADLASSELTHPASAAAPGKIATVAPRSSLAPA